MHYSLTLKKHLTNKVNRNKLISTLIQAGLKGKLLQAIINLTQVNKLTIYDGVSQTNEISQGQGVMQGDPLSSLLFALYVRDIPVTSLPGEAVIAYADDFAYICNTAESLQNVTNRIGRWASNKDMVIHLTKSLTMTIHNRRHRSPTPDITLNGAVLPGVKSTTYLGIHIKADITNMSEHIKIRTAKVKGAIAALNKRHRIYDLKWSTAREIWNSAIEPILTYAFVVVAPHLTASNWATINSIRNTWDRARLGLPRYNTPATFTRQLIKEPDLCCSILHKPCHQGIALYHPVHGVDHQLRQGMDISRSHDPRLLSPADFIDVKRLTGTDRWAVASFSVHGLHRTWCAERGKQCFDARTCLSKGTLCSFCDSITGHMYHLFSECPAFIPTDSENQNSAARLKLLMDFLKPHLAI